MDSNGSQTLARGTPPGVGGNARALVAARVATAVLTLATTPALFDLLGPRRFGAWALIVGVIGILGLADLGLGSAQVRAVAHAGAVGRPAGANGVLALGFVAPAVLALALLAVSAALWDGFAHAFRLGAIASEARTAFLLALLAFVLDGAGSPWRAALEGTQRFRPVALITTAAALVSSVLGLALVGSGAGMGGLGAAFVAAAVIRLSLTVAAARSWSPGIRPSLRAIDRLAIRTVLTYGMRVQASNGAAVLNNDTDRIALGAFFSPGVVASFDLGGKLANGLRLLPTYALVAIFPAAASMHARGERVALDRLYLRITRTIALFSALAAAILVAGSDPLVQLWVGRPIPFAATTLVLLAPGYAINLTTGGASVVTRAEGEPGRETRYALLAAGLNVVLTIPLLLTLGPDGVPLSTSLAYALGTIYYFRHFHRASGRPFRPALEAVWKPFAASASGASIAWLVFGGVRAGPGRLAAAYAFAGRSAVVLTVAVVALAALRFFDEDDRVLLGRSAMRCRSLAAPVLTAFRGGRS